MNEHQSECMLKYLLLNIQSNKEAAGTAPDDRCKSWSLGVACGLEAALEHMYYLEILQPNKEAQQCTSGQSTSTQTSIC